MNKQDQSTQHGVETPARGVGCGLQNCWLSLHTLPVFLITESTNVRQLASMEGNSHQSWAREGLADPHLTLSIQCPQTFSTGIINHKWFIKLVKSKKSVHLNFISLIFGNTHKHTHTHTQTSRERTDRTVQILLTFRTVGWDSITCPWVLTSIPTNKQDTR